MGASGERGGGGQQLSDGDRGAGQGQGQSGGTAAAAFSDPARTANVLPRAGQKKSRLTMRRRAPPATAARGGGAAAWSSRAVPRQRPAGAPVTVAAREPEPGPGPVPPGAATGRSCGGARRLRAVPGPPGRDSLRGQDSLRDSEKAVAHRRAAGHCYGPGWASRRRARHGGTVALAGHGTPARSAGKRYWHARNVTVPSVAEAQRTGTGWNWMFFRIERSGPPVGGPDSVRRPAPVPDPAAAGKAQIRYFLFRVETREVFETSDLRKSPKPTKLCVDHPYAPPRGAGASPRVHVAPKRPRRIYTVRRLCVPCVCRISLLNG